MGRALKEMLRTLAPRQRRAVEKRSAVLIAQELSIGDTRNTMNLSRTEKLEPNAAKSKGKGRTDAKG